MNIKKKIIKSITIIAILANMATIPVFAKEMGGKPVYFKDKVVIQKEDTYIKGEKTMVPFYMIENFMDYKFNQRVNLTDRDGRYYDWIYLDGGSDTTIERVSFYPRTRMYRVNYKNGEVAEGRFFFQEMKDGVLYVSSDIFKIIFKKPIISEKDDHIVYIGSDNLTNLSGKDLEDKSKYPFITASEVEKYIKTKGRDFRTGLSDFDDVESIVKSINKLLKDNIKKNMTNEQKLKAIHDAMCKIVKYGNGDNDEIRLPYYDTATGVAKYGVANCSGYAEYYMLACNAAGIDVGIIHGYMYNGSHAWNFVYKNGVRYNIDITSDDVYEDTPLHKYFYQTDSDMVLYNKTYRFGKEQKSELKKVDNI